MGKPTGFKGPLVVYGERNAPGELASDPDASISMFFGGTGLLDSRGGYSQTRRGAVGFSDTNSIEALLVVPSAISANAIAASQVAVSGTPLTLVATSANGITVVTAANQPAPFFPSSTLAPIGSLAIDGFPSIMPIGLDGEIALWNPATIVQRSVQITSAGNDSGGYFTVSGYDYTGATVTCRVTGANAGVATSLKTFKGIYSIIPGGTMSGAAVQVGQADVYQFPLLASGWEQTDIYYNGALVQTSTGFVAPDTTTPATALTGDTKGTYAVQSASNGTKRLVMFITPSPVALATSPGGLNTALFGVTPA